MGKHDIVCALCGAVATVYGDVYICSTCEQKQGIEGDDDGC